MDDKLYKGPDGVILRFYTKAVRNNFQSEKHGRSVFDAVLYVDCMVPGNSAEAPTFEVIRTYAEEVGSGPDGQRLKEYMPKYEQYKEQVEKYLNDAGNEVADGTPLEQWPVIDVSLVATLRAINVRTVEELAQVHDGNLPNLGTGGRHLREQARAWLSSREFSVPSAQIGAENATLHERVAELEQQLAAANNVIAGLTTELSVAKGGDPANFTAPVVDPLAPAVTAADPLAPKPGKKAASVI